VNGINLIPAHRLVARRKSARFHRWLCIAPACAVLLAASYGYFLSSWDTAAGDVQREIEALDSHIAKVQHQTAPIRSALAEARATLRVSSAVGNQPDWGRFLEVLAERLGPDAVLTSCQLEPIGAPPAENAAPAPKKPSDQPAKAGAPEAGPMPAHYRLTLTGLALTQDAVSRLALDLAQWGAGKATDSAGPVAAAPGPALVKVPTASSGSPGPADSRIFDTVTLVESRRTPFHGADAVSFRIECGITDSPADPGGEAARKPVQTPAPKKGAGT